MASSSSSASVQELVPPINFSLVCPGVYRSGYPTKKNYPFLRALRLRSILYLCPEEYAETNLKFCEENGVALLRFPTEGNKEPFTDISETLMHRILTALVDTRNHPTLIHCNKGKHRTGTVCGCLRLLQGWSLVSIFREYKAFSGNKARVSDQTYIELYYPIVLITPPHVARWLAVTPRTKVVFTQRELEEEEAVQLGASLLAPMPKPEKVSKKNKQQQQQQQDGGVGESNTATSTTAAAPGSPASSNMGVATAVSAASPLASAASTTTTTTHVTTSNAVTGAATAATLVAPSSTATSKAATVKGGDSATPIVITVPPAEATSAPLPPTTIATSHKGNANALRSSTPGSAARGGADSPALSGVPPPTPEAKAGSGKGEKTKRTK